MCSAAPSCSAHISNEIIQSMQQMFEDADHRAFLLSLSRVIFPAQNIFHQKLTEFLPVRAIIKVKRVTAQPAVNGTRLCAILHYGRKKLTLWHSVFQHFCPQRGGNAGEVLPLDDLLAFEPILELAFGLLSGNVFMRAAGLTLGLDQKGLVLVVQLLEFGVPSGQLLPEVLLYRLILLLSLIEGLQQLLIEALYKFQRFLCFDLLLVLLDLLFDQGVVSLLHLFQLLVPSLVVFFLEQHLILPFLHRYQFFHDLLVFYQLVIFVLAPLKPFLQLVIENSQQPYRMAVGGIYFGARPCFGLHGQQFLDIFKARFFSQPEVQVFQQDGYFLLHLFGPLEGKVAVGRKLLLYHVLLIFEFQLQRVLLKLQQTFQCTNFDLSLGLLFFQVLVEGGAFEQFWVKLVGEDGVKLAQFLNALETQFFKGLELSSKTLIDGALLEDLMLGPGKVLLQLFQRDFVVNRPEVLKIMLMEAPPRKVFGGRTIEHYYNFTS